MNTFLKYAGAFVSGYLSALMPILASGRLPDGRAALAAIAPALIATGLLHVPSPTNTVSKL